MVNGYAGKLLRVFLDEKKTKEEELNFDDLRKYIGGVGYGAQLLYDELKEGTDPLGPDNKIVFTTSPLTMNAIPGGGSIELCFKSPLTNGWGESRCGGDFGPEVRKAGYDFIIIEGKADQPVYLVIHDGKVSIKSADHLKGKTVTKKIEEIKKDLSDSDFKVMSIGPGGENLVKYATVMFGGRAAGRCGAGAVMGSKNLLAIAVKGANKITPAKPEEFKKAVRIAMKAVKENPNTDAFGKGGTIGDMPGIDVEGDFPTKNWQSNSWGKGKEIYNCFSHNNLIKNNMCYPGCPVACGRIVQVKNGPYKTPIHEGAEYESIAAFTAFVLNENVDAAVHCTYLCNEYGIDTISTGASIAFAMECYEKVILNQNDVDGLDLTWGNAEVLPILVKKIALRDRIGSLLADGVKQAAQKLGNGSEEFAIHGKGLEAPAHDPRSGKALAITYGTANRGMCHIHPLEAMAYDSGKKDFGMMKYGVPDPLTVDRWEEKGKGKIVKILQDGLIIPDVLNICKFMMYVGCTLEHLAMILSALTGWNISDEDLLKIGERVYNLQRLFNMREGFSRKDDLLPERMKNLPQFGDYKDEKDCEIKNFEEMLNEYYEARGWDKQTGKPLPEKLHDLDIT
ncbi:MAG: aldehyde ferredoxin oxidoreductase family protein [Candidatus Atribacteria bacterium]|nr:aldehyde ferredoxin oxidoreductase family protein [Candidatus Atribacteria bacterium]